MNMKNCFLFALAICFAWSARAEVEVFADLVYAKYGDREMLLDLYKPKNQSGKLPAVVGIHGGGWAKGSKKNFGKHSRYIAERGYVAVAINYRLSGEAPFPVHIQDCKAAVRWLRANANKYGIDPNKIGAIGHSAGGHLAALMATANDVPELEGNGGNAGFSSTIQAAVPMGAQSDLETDRIASMTAQSGAKIWHDFLNGPLAKNEALYQLASPRRHLDENDSPMMFITGELDNLDTRAVPIRDDMRRFKISSGLLIIPEAPHSFLPTEHWRKLALDTAVYFFDRHLKSVAE